MSVTPHEAFHVAGFSDSGVANAAAAALGLDVHFSELQQDRASDWFQGQLEMKCH